MSLPEPTSPDGASGLSPNASIAAALKDAIGCSIALPTKTGSIYRPVQVVEIAADFILIDMAKSAVDAERIESIKAAHNVVAAVCVRVPKDELVFFSQIVDVSEPSPDAATK